MRTGQNSFIEKVRKGLMLLEKSILYYPKFTFACKQLIKHVRHFIVMNLSHDMNLSHTAVCYSMHFRVRVTKRTTNFSVNCALNVSTGAVCEGLIMDSGLKTLAQDINRRSYWK